MTPVVIIATGCAAASAVLCSIQLYLDRRESERRREERRRRLWRMSLANRRAGV